MSRFVKNQSKLWLNATDFPQEIARRPRKGKVTERCPFPVRLWNGRTSTKLRTGFPAQRTSKQLSRAVRMTAQKNPEKRETKKAHRQRGGIAPAGALRLPLRIFAKGAEHAKVSSADLSGQTEN